MAKGLLRAAALTSSAVVVAAAAHHAVPSSTELGARPLPESQYNVSDVIGVIRGGDGKKNAEDDAHNTKSARKRRTSKETSSASKSGTKSNSTKRKPSRVENEILNESDYYKILGLSKDDVKANAQNADQMIQKAYRRRAVQTHPDKTGGDRRAFDKVAEAYDVLQDKEKRKLYDRYGKKGVEAGGMGGAAAPGGASAMHAEELFRSFFGGSAQSPFGGSGNFGPRNRSMRFEVDVTLEDLYAGKTMKVMLPGSKTPIDLNIARGSYHNQNIVASGVLDQDANQPPGDAHFRLKVRPHPVFTCKGYDLAVKMEISLAEAITGVSRTIRHLDGRRLHIVSAPAGATNNGPDVIVSGDVHVLKGEGMPKNAMGTEFGDLYVQYQIQMPKNKHHSKEHPALTEAERQELERLLNKLEGKSDYSSRKSHWPFESSGDSKIMKKASVSEFGKHRPTQNSHDESFGDDGFGAGRGFSPFSQQGFFWHSSSGAPFGQSQPEEEAQCRQM
jgi:DnaJ-class molecular chaperone